jgi:hypothetical protein
VKTNIVKANSAATQPKTANVSSSGASANAFTGSAAQAKSNSNGI